MIAIFLSFFSVFVSYPECNQTMIHSGFGPESLFAASSVVLTWSQEPIPELGAIKIDEYGDISSKEAARRLDDFAKHWKYHSDTEVYVIAFGGQKSWPGEGKERADCAKQYLVKRHQIPATRIILVDGGYDVEPRISLYLRLLTASPPEPFPTVDASKVEVREDYRSKQFRKKCKQLLNKLAPRKKAERKMRH